MANFTVIKVENFKIFAFHGCNESERKEGQYFYINLEASFQANFKQTIFSPENDVVDYSEGSFIVKKPEKPKDILGTLGREKLKEE